MNKPMKIEPLTPTAKEVLGQLFMSGPTWDGNIVSKSGRDELIQLGLAFRESAFASLTSEGVRVAVEWKDFHRPRTNWSLRWLEKASGR